MAFTSWETYTPCEWEKSQTCANKFFACKFCNQIHERQGLRIFADQRIRDYYQSDSKRIEKFKKNRKRVNHEEG